MLCADDPLQLLAEHSIQVGIFAIAALGLNILVGFTGQISIGHAAFFLLGAFTSAYISNKLPIPCSSPFRSRAW